MFFLTRTVLSVLLVCLPIFIFMMFSKQQNAGLIVLLPVFGIIPGLMGAALIFVPIEWALDKIHLSNLKNFVIPLSGPILVIVALSVNSLLSGKGIGAALSEMLSYTFGPSGLWIWYGFAFFWGVSWRFSEWMLRNYFWTANV